MNEQLNYTAVHSGLAPQHYLHHQQPPHSPTAEANLAAAMQMHQVYAAAASMESHRQTAPSMGGMPGIGQGPQGGMITRQPPTTTSAPMSDENRFTETPSRMGAPGGGGESSGDRKLTDSKWLVGFLLFLMLGVGISVDAICKGNIPSLYKGTNYSGLVCGVDSQVLDLPYLYFPLDPQLPTPTLLTKDGRCVKTCPTAKDVADGKTIPVSRRESQVHTDRGSALSMEFKVQTLAYTTTPIGNSICVPTNPLLFAQLKPTLSSTHKQMSLAVGGLVSSWPIIAVCVLVGFCLTAVVWVLTARISSALVSIISFLGVAVVSGGVGVYLIKMGFTPEGDDGKIMKTLFSLNFHFSLIIGIGFLVSSLLMASVLVFSRKSIVTASRVLEVAAIPIADVPSTFLPSLMLASCVFLFLGLWSFVALKIAGMGQLIYEPDVLQLEQNGNFTVLPLHRDMVFTSQGVFYLIYWIIMLAVVCEYALAFLHFVLCYSGTVWYFSPPEGADERDVGWFPSFVAIGLGFFHHSGSFVFGGLLMGLTRPLRVLFNWAAHPADPAKGSHHPVAQIVSPCLGPVVPVMGRLVELFSTAGYIEMSISSTPFLHSMTSASQRLSISSNPSARMTGAALLATWSWVTAVSTGMGALSYFMIRGFDLFSKSTSAAFVSSPILVAATTALFTAILSSYLTAVWDTTADTILYCFLVESIGSDGLIDENPLTKVHAPTQLKELFVDVIEEGMLEEEY